MVICRVLEEGRHPAELIDWHCKCEDRAAYVLSAAKLAVSPFKVSGTNVACCRICLRIALSACSIPAHALCQCRPVEGSCWTFHVRCNPLTKLLAIFHATVSADVSFDLVATFLPCNARQEKMHMLPRYQASFHAVTLQRPTLPPAEHTYVPNLETC